MSDAYGNIIPARWIMPTRATKFEQLVLVNWLQTELPATSRIARRTSRLSGWRNYELERLLLFGHLPQSSSASRFTAGASGFFDL